MMLGVHDVTGTDYSAKRVDDPRIADRIHVALGDSKSVVNVGAGTGSYEPGTRYVVGVEPSLAMIRQRPGCAAPVIRGSAEALPFADDSFDAALAILTVHHWSDTASGLAEMNRVARRRVVLLTWDQDVWESFWLIREYLPCIVDPAVGDWNDRYGGLLDPEELNLGYRLIAAEHGGRDDG